MSKLLLRVTNCTPIISNKVFRLAIPPPLPVHASENDNIITVFNINDYVTNNDDLYGQIINKANNYVIVSWNDNTKERINQHLLENAYLHKITEEEYLSHIDNTEEKKEEPIDLEKLKLSKKVKDLESQLHNQQVATVKNNTAQEIINLAIMKGLIDEADNDMELLKVTAMTDDEFQKYQQHVLDFQPVEGDVTISNNYVEQDEDYLGLSEEEKIAKQELNKLKASGKIMTTASNIAYHSSEKRSLQDIAHNSNEPPVSLEESLWNAFNELSSSNDNQQIPSSIINTDNMIEENISNDNSLQDILDQINVPKKLSNKSKVANKTSSFLKQPFEGITKPLSVGIDSPSVLAPSNSSMNELFAQLDWTTPVNQIANRR